MASFAAENGHLLIMQTIFLAWVRDTGNLSNKIIFFAEKKILTLLTGDIVALVYVILNVWKKCNNFN